MASYMCTMLEMKKIGIAMYKSVRKSYWKDEQLEIGVSGCASPLVFDELVPFSSKTETGSLVRIKQRLRYDSR